MATHSHSRSARLAVVAALAAPLVLAACGGGTASAPAASEEVKSIRVVDYYNNEPDNTIYATALGACAAENGVTIDRQAVPGADLIAKVLQQASSKTLPDILMLDNPDLQQIAATGALAPIGDFGLSAEGEAQGVIDASTYKGKVYGLQPVTNTIALFYNKDILKAAGITPPTTWDELKAAAAALTSGDQYGVAFSAPSTYEGTWQFLPFMWSNGGDEKNIATPQTAAALQLWVDLKNSRSASESVVTWTQADVNDQFIAGNAAMMVNGPWQLPVLNKATNLHFGIVPIPAPKAGDKVVAPLGGETWTIPNTGNKARQAIAAKVVNCLNSDKNQLSLAAGRQTVPTRTALDKQFIVANPSMEAFSQLVKTARARTGELGDAWPAAATKIYTAVQLALVGGVTPTEALQQAQNG